MARERSMYPGGFDWHEQTYFVLCRDYGITRRPAPDELHRYAAAGLTVNEAARRYAAAGGSPRRPMPEPDAKPAPPKQSTLFD